MTNAVAGTVADLFGNPDEAAEEPNSETAAPEAQVAEPEVDFNPELPEDLLEFLEEPDDEEDEVQVGTIETDDEEVYLDPEELARQNAKLKKKIEWEQKKALSASRKAWAAEAQKYAPLSRPETITATSRRAFLREAKAQHDQNYKLVAPIVDQYRKKEENIRVEVERQVRAELEQAWGRPTVGAAGAPSLASQKADDLQKARNSRNLTGAVKALINANEI